VDLRLDRLRSGYCGPACAVEAAAPRWPPLQPPASGLRQRSAVERDCGSRPGVALSEAGCEHAARHAPRHRSAGSRPGARDRPRPGSRSIMYRRPRAISWRGQAAGRSGDQREAAGASGAPVMVAQTPRARPMQSQPTPSRSHSGNRVSVSASGTLPGPVRIWSSASPSSASTAPRSSTCSAAPSRCCRPSSMPTSSLLELVDGIAAMTGHQRVALRRRLT
jgi:hypothetical protein